ILSIGVTVWVQGHGGAVRTIEELPLLARVENVVVSYARYLGILVWPKDLCAFYPFPGRWPIMWTVGSTILLIVITLLGVVMAKRKPFVLVGWLWFMGTLVPVIGLVQVGSQSIADRYTYIPSIGVFMALAWGVDEMAGRFRHGRRWQWAVGVAVSVALAAATYVQAGRWQNNAILYRHTLAVSRSFNVYAHYFVGIDCFERGDDAEARRHFELIVKAAPAFSKGHAALGTVLAHQRDYDRALTHLKRALVLEPDVADVHLNVAQILDDRGDAAGAKAHYLDVLRLDPESYVANYRLGRLYWRAGDHARAAIHFERALIENPHDHAAKRAFIEACLALGQRDRAVRECLDWMTWARGVDSWMRLAEQFERLNMLHEAATALAKAVAADPANPESYHRLGIFLAAYGQTNLAIGYLEVAVRLHGDNSSARMALATALLSLGRTQEAILQLRQASIRRPEDTTLALHATGLLLRHGKTQEAISFFQEAWKRNPRLSLAAIDWIEQLHDTDQRKQAILFFDSLRAFVLENNQHELASAMDALARLLTVKGTRP
ncbi:MAG TPA: tetratricopeptide repeat protein, partial [Polyangiaceae bacterium]|nr:tetratricopeptide repeat protein [Polyangiaceae bacterium]